MSDNTVSPAILAAIHEAVESAVSRAIEPWRNELQELRLKMTQMQDEKEALSFELASSREEIDKLQKKSEDRATTSALKATDAEVHSRKWNLIIHGIPGEKGECETSTEQKVRDFAATDLRIEEAKNRESLPFSACHRLQQKQNAGIIVRFSNLADRNNWLKNAKNLQTSNKNISISPDIPQVLKPLKTELLNERKELPPKQKKTAKIQYHKTWPYISLKINENLYKPNYNLETFTTSFYQPSPAQ